MGGEEQKRNRDEFENQDEANQDEATLDDFQQRLAQAQQRRRAEQMRRAEQPLLTQAERAEQARIAAQERARQQINNAGQSEEQLEELRRRTANGETSITDFL